MEPEKKSERNRNLKKKIKDDIIGRIQNE